MLSQSQLFLNSSQQSKDMIDGLDFICDLLELYNLKESIYLRHKDSPAHQAHQGCVEAVEKLYTHIFEYQAQLIRYLSKSSIKRAARSTFQLDKWKELLDKVKESDNQCTERFKLMSVEKDQEFCSQNLSSWKQSIEIYERMLKMAESSQVREQLIRQDDHETALLRTLSPPNTDYKRDKNVNSARVAGTCEWFFEDERFLNWRNSKSSELLWVSAGPGCGKSVLARALIDERRVCTNVMASTVCYFFFKDGQQKRMDGASALCAILHQLFRNRTNLITHGLPTHRSCGDSLQNKFSELWEILINASEDPEAGQIVCILDALDECEQNERKELISELVKLFSETVAQQNRSFRLKFLVTSRHYDDIEGNFEPLLDVSTFVRFDGNDKSHVIAEEINLVIDAKLPKIATGFNAEDRESIRKRLKEMDNRTYLWLFLTIDIITGSRSKYGKISSIKKLLSNLPPKISDAYERILERSSDKDVARILLQIMVATTRPLSLEEANVALTLATQEPSPGSYKKLELWPLSSFESTVQNLCGLFVSVHDGKLSLIHQTAREFLLRTSDSQSKDPGKWQGCFDITEAHGTISKVCLDYLSFGDLAGREGSECEDGYTRLFDYAAKNWPDHYNLQSSKLAKDSRRAAHMLCNTEALEDLWVPIYNEAQNYPGQRSLLGDSLTNASWLGLVYVVEDVLNEGADVYAQHCGFDKALYIASYRGHYQVVQLLLEKGADVNAQGSESSRALTTALYYSQDQIVLMLLKNGFNLESANLHQSGLRKLQRLLARETNLDQADLSEYLQQVQELLERANIDAQDG